MVRVKTSFLRKIPWLSGVPVARVDALVARTDALRISRGDTLWRSGDVPDSIYWVHGGVLREERDAAAGRTVTLRFMGRGALVGFDALFCDSARRSRAVAHETAVIYRTPLFVAQALVDAQPALRSRLQRALVDRARSLEARLGAVLSEPVRGRISSVLWELAPEVGVRDAAGVQLAIRLTQRDLAAMVGATRESVALALAELDKAGLIERRGRRIVLLDAQASFPISTPSRRLHRGV